MVGNVINGLMVTVLVGFVVAVILLISLLYRANRLVYKLEHLQETFKAFVRDIVPAIVNIGTISTALHSVLRSMHEERHSAKSQEHKK
ncbi:MAG TPA: hypothetical protein VMQ44_02930 [Candidatus Saccharimonadales bacterium]|nr:hypothetical protein [Candidatus Saccharimonadales bacterium]